MKNPRHIAITGASSGLGQALAHLYAAPQIHLSLHGRNAQRLAEVGAQCQRQGATLSCTPGDVTNQSEMSAWIETIDQQTPLDLLIANAGISGGTGRASRLEKTEQSRQILRTNLEGVLNTIEPAIPLMQKRRHGQIALMASLAGFRGMAGAASYCASKAAVRLYGESLRLALAQDGLEVNVICPGFIKTPMTDVNPFPMPFIMDAARAAHIIQKGLTQNQARISFPRPLSALLWVLTALPPGITDGFLGKLPSKPAFD